MKKFISLSVAVLLSASALVAQDTNKFTTIKDVTITSVKDQANSGTCWAYSGQGFLENELAKKGHKDVDLSEMFVVNHSYKDKARKYVRLHGKLNFAQGGSFYDVIYVLKNYGAVPQNVMPGLNYGTDKNMHSEMEQAGKAFLDKIISNPNGKLSTAWGTAFDAIIDSYLGKTPESFKVNGKTYTPKEYAKSLGLDADDYISLTSYTDHPFYSQYPLEIEDNWRWAMSYNLPIAELMQVMENAIEQGYSIAWGTDVSEIGFTRDGLAVLADVKAIETKGSDQDRWVGMNRAEKNAEIMKLIKSPDCPEINPTQEYRQKTYDNYELTDDHGMVIFGTAKNQVGKKFFMVKNSWGETGDYKGIWYASYNFVAGKTMNIVVNKKALPKEIAKKLGIKI